MNKGVAVWTFAAMAAAMAGWLYVHDVDDSPRPAASGSAAASAAAGPGESDAGAPRSQPPVGPGVGDAGFDDELSLDIDAGFDVPDGGEDPAALDDAPKAIRFGVVLVQYKGAQGAPDDARSRDEAQKLAEELAGVAKDDFAAAVKRGDKGSSEDLGEMYRGIMEPAPELELFSLEVDQISAPFDTPRGYWIAKRLK